MLFLPPPGPFLANLRELCVAQILFFHAREKLLFKEI